MVSKKDDKVNVAMQISEPTTGQLIEASIASQIDLDIRMAASFRAFEAVKSRVMHLKAAWGDQVDMLNKNWSYFGAMLLRALIKARRPIVLQMLRSVSGAVETSGMKLIEEEVDNLLSEVLALIVKPGG